MIYNANGIYSDSTNTLQHYGRKGMKWGQHIFGEDQVHHPRKKKRKSVQQWMADKDRANLANAQANKYQLSTNATVSVNNKTKKLPSTNLGLLMKYKSLSEAEYKKAQQEIRRRNEIYDAVINDAYRLHRAVNFAPTVLNDAVRLAKNIDYISDKVQTRKKKNPLGKTTIVQAPSQPTVRKHTPGKTKAPNSLNKAVLDALRDELEHHDPITKGKYLRHSDPLGLSNVMMSDLYSGEHLSHYGRKGMKWGQHIFGEDPAKRTVRKRKDGGTIDERDRHVKVSQQDKIRKTNTVINAVMLDPFAIASLVKDRKAAKAMQNYLVRRNTTCKKDPETGLYLKNHEMTKDQDLQMVNPEKNSSASGVRSNCMLCTAAYDLRRRGYDVVANYAVVGYQDDIYKKWYPKSRQKTSTMLEKDSEGRYRYPSSIKTMDDFRKAHAEFKTQALKSIESVVKNEGSRGNIMVTWKYGGGHSMAYEVEDHKLVIYDAQSGRKYRDAQIDALLNVSCELTTIRLDNVKPNIEAMKKDGVIL